MQASRSGEEALLIEVRKVTPEGLPRSLDALRGCWKSSSLVWMQASDFPVLPGIIVRGWSPESGDAISRFCRDRGFSELLVRIEKPFQRWTRQRGGYTIAFDNVRSFIENLTNEQMLAILLEPATPNSDLYSLTCVSDVSVGKIDVEVVGPGFDASDILRADITPHERFEITAELKSAAARKRDRPRIERTYLVDLETYLGSVRRRLAKVGARLENPAFPDELIPTTNAPDAMERLIEGATRYLRKSGQTLLLEHSEHYDPIPRQLLDRFLQQVLKLSRAVAESSVPWRTFSLAGSFLSQNRLVIWDFFPPGDYDSTSLQYVHAPPSAS